MHVGIVTQVWPDGAIMTVSGDSGPGRDGYLSVTLDGPFLPADSSPYNGMGIYALHPAVGRPDTQELPSGGTEAGDAPSPERELRLQGRPKHPLN